MKLTRKPLIGGAIGFLVILISIWYWKDPSFPNSFASPPPMQLPPPHFPIGAFVIEGQVVDAKGKGIPGSWIFLTGNRKLSPGVCNEQGQFRVDRLPEGEFEITAGAAGFRPSKVAVKSGSGSITIGLQPLSVFGDGPYPEPRGQQSSSNISRISSKQMPLNSLSVALFPKDPRTPGGVLHADVGSDGFFELPALPYGEYNLRVLSAARSYDLDFCYKELPILIHAEQRLPDLIEIEAQSVRGRVMTPPSLDYFPPADAPLPCADAIVKLQLKTSSGRLSEAGMLKTNQNGEFEFPHSPVGEYELHVWAPEFETYQVPVQNQIEKETDLQVLLRWKPR